MKTNTRWALVPLCAFCFVLLVALEIGGSGGCNSTSSSSSSSSSSRKLKGSLSSSSLSKLAANAGLVLAGKKATLACDQAQIKCITYKGSETKVDLGSDCSFDIDLPLNSHEGCCLFDKSSGTELGCLSCDGSTSLPIYAGTAGETTEVDLGTLTSSGNTTASETLCDSVDEDGDGKSNTDDTDDDGDGTADTSDLYDTEGFRDFLHVDTDEDGVSDVYESSVWAGFGDKDGDGVPNVCDADIDGDGQVNEKDTDDDGDGILDTADADENADGVNDDAIDTDGDGVPNDIDGDIDGDGTDNASDTDDDGDGVLNASDTDKNGDGVADSSEVDANGDGVDDSFETGTEKCPDSQECVVGEALGGDFACQQFADNNPDNTLGITTANAKCSDGCCIKGP